MTDVVETGPADPEAEDLRDELVDRFNARDLDGIAELLADDVTADVFDGVGVDAALEGLSDLWIRYPRLVASRAEHGDDPVVALWLPGEDGKFRSIGFLECTNEGEKIEHVSYVDGDESGLVADAPDEGELAEWLDWAEWDRGEESTPDGPFG